MDLKDVANLGGDIMDIVTRSIETGDFSGLSSDLKSRIDDYKEQTGFKTKNKWAEPVYWRVREDGEPVGEDPRKTVPAAQENRGGSVNRQNVQRPKGGYARQQPGYSRERYERQEARRARQFSRLRTRTPFFRKLPGYAGPILKLVFGIGGLVIMGGTTISMVAGMIGSLTGTAISSVLVAGAMTAGFLALTVSGAMDKKLTDRFYNYGRIVGPAEYVSVDELSAMSDEKPGKTAGMLKKMIEKRMLPYARMDVNKSVLLLTQRSFDQYREALASYQQRVDQEVADSREREAQNEGLSEETRAILEEGEAYLTMVHHSNDLIEGEEMSARLSRLESIISRIFERVREHQENARDLRKFLSYYLPTTEKLLKVYIDLDRQPHRAGENIDGTKREIEDAMGTINNAFENLLDSLFEDVAWDISSDISVMKMMMEQDGLTESINNADEEQQ
jgi:hypothetical protein